MCNDQLSIHNKAKNKKIQTNKNCQLPNQSSQNPFSKTLSVQTHDISLFENMIKATNPLLRPSLVHLRHEEWQNLEPKWGPGMRKCGGVGEGLGEEVRS